MAYYATLGYTPEVLQDAAEFVDEPIVVFHGDENTRQRVAKQAVSHLLKQLGAKAHFVEVAEPWNFRACFEAVAAEHRRQGSPEVVVNASGGTEVMNSAMTVFALLTASRCHYVDRKQLTVEVVDFQALRRAIALDGSRAEFLEFVLAAGGRTALGEVPGSLGVTAGAVSQLLADLADRKLLTAKRSSAGRGKTIEVSNDLWPLASLGGLG